MSSYRSDQWYDLGQERSGEDDPNVGASDTVLRAGAPVADSNNKDFVYPSRLIRTGTNSVVDVGGDVQTATRRVLPMQRGYIRSLTTKTNEIGLPERKCQFQFNPQFLVQSVSQNTTILNFLQQDPAQYAQPIPGNVSFSFELFFDRSMELNNAPPAGSAPDQTSPWERSDPAYIGVLHDISAFYSVIGVGLSDAMGKYAQKVLENSVQNELADRLLDAGGDSETTFDADAEYASATTSINDLLKYNMGNTAFLLPLPVRVVFSSLYIVEGLVKDVTVTFTKFTRTMVPMQCTLNVLFEAKYIGFAQKDTFFTNVLTEAEDTDYNKYKNTNTATPTEVAQYVAALSKDLDQITMFPAKWASVNDTTQNYQPVAFTKDGAFLYKMVSHKDKDDLEDGDLRLATSFPRSGAYIANMAQAGGREVSVNVTGTVELWRYDQTFADEYPELVATAIQGPGITQPYTPVANRIPPYDPAYRALCRKLLSALRGWKDTAPSNSIQLPDADGNDQRFQRVQRVWTMHMSDESVQDLDRSGTGVFGSSWLANDDIEFKNTASGITELNTMFDLGIVTRPMVPPKYESIGGNYDRSLSLGSGTGDKYPDHDNFRYIAEYKMTVTVTIDGNVYENTCLDYVNIPVFGIGDDATKEDGFTLIKTMSFDWGSEEVTGIEDPFVVT
jgi:hypothetical protein